MATKRKTTSTPAQAETTAVADAAAPTPSLQFIDLDVIDTLPQVRTVFDEDALAELAESIKLRGMLQPILLRSGQGKLGNRYIVIAGERRLRAARLAGLTAVPALVGDVPENLAAEMQLVENIQREELSLAETAAGVLKLYELHQAQQPIAKMLGKSVPWVSKHLAAATKLCWQASSMLTEGKTEDLELLLTMDQLFKLSPSMAANERIYALKSKITAKEAGRTEARALLSEIRREIEQREAEAKATKAKKKQGTPNLEPSKAPEPPAWHAYNELSTLHDLLCAADHEPIEKLLSHLDEKQLQAMVEECGDEWAAGNAAHKGTGAVKMRAMARFMDSSYAEISLETAAFILGACNIELTIADLAAEFHQLIHVK